MKKTILSICGFAAMLFVLTGCTTTYRDAQAMYLDTPPSSGTTPFYTDYKVDQNRIASRGESSVLFWVFHFSEGKQCIVNSNPKLSFFSPLLDLLSPTQKAVNNAKGAAVFNACESAQADHLLGATFEYRITNYFFYAKVFCTVKGYPAVSKGVKMLDKQPIILNKWQKIDYVSPFGVVKDYSSNSSGMASVYMKQEK